VQKTKLATQEEMAKLKFRALKRDDRIMQALAGTASLSRARNLPDRSTVSNESPVRLTRRMYHSAKMQGIAGKVLRVGRSSSSSS
jgi:hypothetical protein